MGKGRKKPGTAGSQAPAVPPSDADVPQRYRFTRKHQHANVDYIAGDTAMLTRKAAERIRQFAGDDALIHEPE